MSTALHAENSAVSHRQQLEALFHAGLLIDCGVPGVYGVNGVFEDVIERFDRYVTRMGADKRPEILRFPPLLSRRHYLQSGQLETMPQLMGSVHSFCGTEADAARLAARVRKDGDWTDGDWTDGLGPTDLMLPPAACHALYPTVRGSLPPEGRTVDLRGFVFRREPSEDPARWQMFRQREYVRLGSPQQAEAHRDEWVTRGLELLQAIGLSVEAVVATDPFFGRGGKVLAATQREGCLKFELLVPIGSHGTKAAVASCNYHLDHFGQAFGFETSDGQPGHSACVGFGLERIALALFTAHGFSPAAWPLAVRNALAP